MKAMTKTTTGLGIVVAISTEAIATPITFASIMLGISEFMDGQHNIFETEFCDK